MTDDTPEAHAIMQRRLTLFTGLVAALSGFFYLTGVLVTAIAHPAYLVETMTHPATIWHLVATFLVGVLCVVARRGPSMRVLDAIDVAGTVIVCVVYSLMVFGQQQSGFPEHIVLLAISWTLVARAGLVPSNTMRTAAVSALGMLPAIVMTYVVALSSPAPFMRALYVVFWAAIAVTTTSVISRIIYGLRQQVREAMQVGQYTLDEVIGEGGMGVVYRARHALLRRPTAIKLLPPGRSGARDLARFEREVQLTSALSHPNTIAIYDFGRTPDGLFYYVMEYLEGFTLEDLVRVDGPQPHARVVHLLRQCCGALQEAHEAGLVHRDVKPANVFVTRRGGIYDVAKVLDFGLVMVSEDRATNDTDKGALHGTPHYLAPESIVSPSSVDARADIYALGAVAYFLVTGKTVFEATSLVEACAKHVHEAPVPPSKRIDAPIPAELDEIVMACLEKDPKDRPQSAEALAARLDAVEGAWRERDARAWWTSHAADVSKGARARRKTTAERARQRSVIVDIGAR